MPGAANFRLLVPLGGLLLVALLSLRPPPAVPISVDGEITEPVAQTWKPPRLDPATLPPGSPAAVGSSRFYHPDLIQPVTFAPDGRTLYVGTAEREGLYAWDTDTGQRRWRATFAEREPASASRSLTPDDIGFVGRLPAVLLPDAAGREGVVRFDPATGKEAGRVTLESAPAVDRYRFSPDGTRVAVARGPGLAMYDTASGRRLFDRRFENPIGGREGLDFSPDGRTLAVGDHAGSVHLLRADTGQTVRDIQTEYRHSPLGVRFALGGETLVARSMTSSWHPVLLLDVATGTVRHQLQTAGVHRHVWTAVLSPDGKQLYVACRVYPEAGGLADTVVVWDVATGRELRGFPCTVPFHLAVRPDGRVLATADGRTVELLDATTGRPLPQSSDPVGGYEQFRVVPDGGWVGLSDVGVDVIDATGRRSSRFTLPATGETAWWGHLSPDGSRLVRTRNTLRTERLGPVEVWDVRSGTRLAEFGRETTDQPVDWVMRVGQQVRGFTPDGSTVFTSPGVPPDPIRAWDTGTGRPVNMPAGCGTSHRWSVFSPDGRRLATCRETVALVHELVVIPQEVVVVEVATGRLVAIAKGVKPPRISCVAFSPDGRQLAVAPDHKTDLINNRPPVSDDLVYLFELPSGREVGRLRGPDGSIEQLAFAPDGRSLATAGEGRVVRVWDLAMLRPRLSVPHARLPRVLTFSSDGRTLATDGQENPVELWAIPNPAPGKD